MSDTRSPEAQANAMPLTGRAREACAVLPAAVRAEGETVIEVLRLLGCDDETCASALWFSLRKHMPAAAEEAAKHWAPTLRRLVEGQGEAEKVWALHAQRGPASGAEGLRRLLLAIIRDLRVVFVLLARQLAAMRTAMSLPEDERRELAQLTSDIHAPLANRLGIWQLKWELEDLAFRYLEPETYRRIARLLDERRSELAARRDGLAAGLAAASSHLARVLLIEDEYALAMTRAELDWLDATIGQLDDGTLIWDTATLAATRGRSAVSGDGP